MISNEILRLFLAGSMTGFSALKELNSICKNPSTRIELIESAKSKYVIGFIHRYTQYQNGLASEKDVCVNLRDIILFLGRQTVPLDLYKIVKAYGQEFDLVCESDNVISCSRRIPSFLKSQNFIDEVYDFRIQEDDLDQMSYGDSILSSVTHFLNYKNYEQKLAVQTALKLPHGHTLLISLPTGGGKSLVTQMLAGTSVGLSLVIVPTVALAADQYSAAVNNLKSPDGIFCYQGELAKSEKQKIISALRKKECRILFSSPEAIIKNDELFQLLSQYAEDGFIDNIIIDEAHIVPDWGVFFRPDFQIFSVILKKWRCMSNNKIRTYLLSATLSDDVVDTLFALFGENKKNVQVRCDSLRQEPRFYFHSTHTKEEQKNNAIEAAILLPKPMVIYVLEPKDAENLQAAFLEKGFKNIPVYTGNTKKNLRDEILQKWKNNECDIVIATSAFGIGVDKADVRTIIHACVPENLSRFYQEVGRAGRDHLPSLSVLLPFQTREGDEGDTKRALSLVNKRVLTVERIISRWIGMINNVVSIEGDICVLNTASTPPTMSPDEVEFAGNLNISWNVNCLLFLHRTGFVELLDATYQISSKAYFLTIKLLKPEILGSISLLEEELISPREFELQLQLQGYRIMRDLVQNPTSSCWGHIFKHLFPLSKEVCNGCPVDKKGKISSDTIYKLRIKPELILPAELPSRKLDRKMGSYHDLIITASDTTNSNFIDLICQKAKQYGIGSIVLPDQIISPYSSENNCVLSYSEFYFTVQYAPYLFNDGVLCVLCSDINTNTTLFEHMKKLELYGYRKVYFCNESVKVLTTGKTLLNSVESYSLSLDRI